MKKYESEEKNMLKDWINTTGMDRAPEGFMHKIMTQVELEPRSNIESYSGVIGKKFKITAIAATFILLVTAFFIPGNNWAINSKISSFSLPDITFPNIHLPSINLPINIPIQYLFLAIGLIAILSLFDRALFKLFKKM